jgi:parvulin-like peptidyl-prolyl isomerase
VIRLLPRLRGFVALAVLAVAAAACSNVGGAPAASVGAAEISDERLQVDIASFTFLVGLSGAPCGTPTGGERQDAACARFTLTNEIQEEIVKAYATSHDLAVQESDVTDSIAQLEQNLGGAEALDAQLDQAGLTRADLHSLARRLVLFSVVQQAVVAERLDDETLRSIYDSSRAQFTNVEVAHILVATRREAEDVAAQATPENFARLAKQRSIDQVSAAAGGSLGTFSEAQFAQQFDPTFVQAAIALQPGEISGVVQTQFGYHVIELVRRDTPTFEQVRDQLASQQGPQVFQLWLQEQYASTDISVNPRYGRLDDTTGEVVAIDSTQDTPTPTGASGATGAAGTTASP